ncbi:DNA damage-regulated autophagy modulator protein 1-like [Babylonia areolata]|uniref:DNA damage-regulated autophagy modulator protein 1-like n=1 Tax=Babylonia areolata TaxID=304850 RepID=UPI003FD526B9
MLCHRLHIFPVIMALYLPVTFFVTYGMAVHNDHVEPLFPYISDTGTIAPESCVFGQLLNIYAALTAWCMYLRYKQVRRYYRCIESQGLEPGSARQKSVRRKHIINRLCLVIGLVASLGISVVANFQEDNLLSVHLLGAGMAFGGAGLYCWLQSLISYKMANLPSSRQWCRHARLVLSVLYSMAILIMLITTKLSIDKFPLSLKMIKKWKPSQPGYTEHLFATFAEWVMAFLSSAYFLTFVGEWKVVRTKVMIFPMDASHEDTNTSATITSGEVELSETRGEPLSADCEKADACSHDGGGGDSNGLEPFSCELVVGKVSVD